MPGLRQSTSLMPWASACFTRMPRWERAPVAPLHRWPRFTAGGATETRSIGPARVNFPVLLWVFRASPGTVRTGRPRDIVMTEASISFGPRCRVTAVHVTMQTQTVDVDNKDSATELVFSSHFPRNRQQSTPQQAGAGTGTGRSGVGQEPTAAATDRGPAIRRSFPKRGHPSAASHAQPKSLSSRHWHTTGAWIRHGRSHNRDSLRCG